MNRRQIIKGGVAAIASSLLLNPFDAFALVKDRQGIDQLIETGTVINAGIGGNNTIDLLNRVDKDCLAFHPKLIILMVGTNDMNSAKYVPLGNYENNLNQLVKKIKTSGSKLLMMSILPMYEPHLLTRHPEVFYQPEGVEGRRKSVNAVIKKIAEKQKAHYLDLSHRFEAIGKIGTDRDSLIQNEANSNKKDGIHPTANGYRFIALTVYDYIVDHKLPKTDIVCFGDSITKGDGTIDRDSYPAYLKKLIQS